MKFFLIPILSLQMMLIEFGSSQTLTTDEMTTEENPCSAQGKFSLDLVDFCKISQRIRKDYVGFLQYFLKSYNLRSC
jgi:hypothetical protein